MKKLASVVLISGVVALMGVGCASTPTAVPSPSPSAAPAAQPIKPGAPLSANDILTASYVISSNATGGIPAQSVVFPALTNDDGQWLPGVSGTEFLYKDGTSSAHTLVSGKDYEAFWIYKYKLSDDQTSATVYVSGNLGGKGNDNRIFTMLKTNGAVSAKELPNAQWKPEDIK